MTIQMDKNRRLTVTKDKQAGEATIEVMVRTPEGWETEDTDTVELATLKEVLIMFYGVPEKEVRV